MTSLYHLCVRHKVPPQSIYPIHLYSLYSQLQNVNTLLLDSRLGPTLSSLVAEQKLNSKITTLIKTTNFSSCLPSSFTSHLHFLNILLLKCCLFHPQFYLLGVHLPDPELSSRHCCCGRKVVILEFSFFLLPTKTEWALVYCPEALCLHSAGSYTDCTN